VIRRRLLLGSAGALLARTARAQGKWQYRPVGILHREIRFPGASGVTLSGTLTLPSIVEIQRVPGVVMIAGSGPTDRDGNNPLIPVRVDLLKQFAETLAQAGIGSLRYDKRGIGASTPLPRDSLQSMERFAAWNLFVEDARAAHVELRRHDEIKDYATAFLGHSEGGLLALAAATEMGKNGPYALVLAATPGLPLHALLRAQIERAAPQLVPAAERVMDVAIGTGHVPDKVPKALQPDFPPYLGPFLQGALIFDPAKAAASLTAPCLLLQGGADTQVVAMRDVQPLVDALARRNEPAEVLVVPNVSHNLKQVTGPDDPGFAGPVAAPLSAKLVSWLGRVLGA
jgi:hypothetical protein